MKNSQIQICPVGDHPTIRYAAEELQKYLGRMAVTGDGEIKVGLMSAFPHVQTPSVADPALDDAVYIDVDGGKGYIAGINPRSVLLAAYRYLTEIGCRWVRPGADGEYIPTRTDLPTVKMAETPSYRHRGICIEGAVSYEHVRDMVEWIPRVGMNCYFTQFREAHTFFDRWYAHAGNPLLEGRHISIEEAGEYTARVVDEIKKRDLVYHGVGHGWTCEPFGISGLGWEQSGEEIPDSVRQYLAEIDGKRELWHGVALNTNLCYGNPEVRRIITNEIADYSEKHPQIDVMHFWLADGSNNNCECELCRDARPADFYVMMLNELDEELTRRGLGARIVFLIYVDLLWPPLQEKIKNPGRFILMFAPITRTYSSAFVGGDSSRRSRSGEPSHNTDLPEYKRNKLDFPKSVDVNIAFLKAWQGIFAGDSFDFDYHLMWDHINDPGYTQVSDIIAQDMKGLRDLGLNGLVSCQVQRAFFPTGLPMTAMARALWDSSIGFDKIAGDYFEGAFGPDGKACRAYLTKLSELFDPVYMRGEKPAVSDEAAGRLSQIPQVIREFLPTIERNIGNENPCRAKSWLYMKYHAEICTLLAEALEARARDDKQTALDIFEKVKQYVRENEMALHPVLDVWNFQNVLGWKFNFQQH